MTRTASNESTSCHCQHETAPDHPVLDARPDAWRLSIVRDGSV